VSLQGFDAKMNWLAVNRQSERDFDFMTSVEFSCGALVSEQRCDHSSWKISIVKIRHQETTSKTKLRRFSMYSSDL
jgi:hypothetical protein